MQIDYEIIDSKLVCTGSPEDWLGSQIQVVVSLGDYQNEDEAREFGASLVESRYQEVTNNH